MSGHILLTTAGLTGLLYSSVELGRRLVVAGHRVTYAGPVSARCLAETHGLDFVAMDPGRYDRFLESDARVGTLARLSNLSGRRRQAVESMALNGWLATVRDLEPDLLLIDGEMHEHIIAVSSSGVPIALLNSFASIWRRPGLPPPHRRVRPGVGWKGTRLGIWVLWRELRFRKWRRAALQSIRRIGCDRLSILRLLAQRADFDLHRETDSSQWLIPFTYRRFPVLSLHALEFEFLHRPPDHVHYIGPMVLESRNDRPMTDAASAELDAVIEQRKSNEQRRLIYAGFGSVFSTELDLLRRLIATVAERPDWALVMSLSDRIAPEVLGELPERVHTCAWLPQVRILEHADVAVVHGGINSIDECVLGGVPMLVYCGFETDMAGNTARVVHHGLGIEGDRHRDSTAIIGGRIGQLLSERRFRDSLRQLQDSYARYARERVAERVVASLLTGGPASLGPDSSSSRRGRSS